VGSNREPKTQQTRPIAQHQQATRWKWYPYGAHSFRDIAKQRTSLANIFRYIVATEDE